MTSYYQRNKGRKRKQKIPSPRRDKATLPSPKCKVEEAEQQQSAFLQQQTVNLQMRAHGLRSGSAVRATEEVAVSHVFLSLAFKQINVRSPGLLPLRQLDRWEGTYHAF